MNNCVKCIEIKNILNEKGIKYEEFDINDDMSLMEVFQKNNIKSIPILKRDEDYIHGSDLYDFVDRI